MVTGQQPTAPTSADRLEGLLTSFTDAINAEWLVQTPGLEGTANTRFKARGWLYFAFRDNSQLVVVWEPAYTRWCVVRKTQPGQRPAAAPELYRNDGSPHGRSAAPQQRIPGLSAPRAALAPPARPPAGEGAWQEPRDEGPRPPVPTERPERPIGVELPGWVPTAGHAGRDTEPTVVEANGASCLQCGWPGVAGEECSVCGYEVVATPGDIERSVMSVAANGAPTPS